MYDHEEIINMNDNDLLTLINQSQYPGYRLGDVVRFFPEEKVYHIKQTKNWHNRVGLNHKQLAKNHVSKYPNSIASKYVTVCQEKKISTSIEDNIYHNISIDVHLSILDNLCNEIDISKPCETDLVACIRLGDMIDKNDQKYNGHVLAKNGGSFTTLVGRTRKILCVNEIIQECEKNNCKRIILVGSAFGSGIKSVEYLKTMITSITNHGYSCYWFRSNNPDIDLAYMCHAKHIIPGPGGFVKIATLINKFKINNLQLNMVLCPKDN